MKVIVEAINTIAIPIVTYSFNVTKFQCFLLEFRRNKANGQKDTKATDLE